MPPDYWIKVNRNLSGKISIETICEISIFHLFSCCFFLALISKTKLKDRTKIIMLKLILIMYHHTKDTGTKNYAKLFLNGSTN